MRKFYFLLLTLFIFSSNNAQIVNIPDANFKAMLVQADETYSVAKDINLQPVKIDTNNDSEIQLSEALNIYELNIYSGPSSGIADLTGLDSFTNITALTISGSGIMVPTVDFSMLINLKYIATEGMGLTSININGLIHLESFSCDNMTALTNITMDGLSSLSIFSCSHTQLTALDFSDCPDLSMIVLNYQNLASLNISNCHNLTTALIDNNLLTSIDLSGSNHLETLQCGNNPLTSLNLTGCPNLTSLAASNTQITELDLSMLPALGAMQVSHNQITVLDISNNPLLSQIDCSYCMLSTLDVSNFQKLDGLLCDHNELTTLNISNTPFLSSLECSDNVLSTLDISDHQYLYNLNCGYNELETLDISGCPKIHTLSIDNNQLTELNLDEIITPTLVSVVNNPLVSLFTKNGLQDAITFGNNPLLQYICADQNEITALQNAAITAGASNCIVNDYCSFEPGGTFYTIHGQAKLDADNNGCDLQDFPYTHLKLNVSSGAINGTEIFDGSGNYTILLGSGYYTITPKIENPSYFTISPTSFSASFPYTENPLVQDFCITPNGTHPDLEITLIPIGVARPGFDVKYKMLVTNKGNTVQSCTALLSFDDATMDFVSAVPAVSTQVPSLLSWDFTNLQPFEAKEIIFSFNLNSPTDEPAVNGGDMIAFEGIVISSATDNTPNNNTFDLHQTVVNSFDPNDKTCLEGDVVTPDMAGKYVHYRIRFENTGTYPAENIVVKDIIDTAKFDITSLVPVDGSHPFTARITDTNKVEFIFENINLPFDDANNDGYVVFKIKTKPSLINGGSFSNTASIYFDYNHPIITNTATTTIYVLGKDDFEFGNYFTLYPNPTKDLLHINSKGNIEATSITVYNTLGQLVLAVPNAGPVATVDVSNLAVGTYVIKINSDKGSSSSKFMKK